MELSQYIECFRRNLPHRFIIALIDVCVHGDRDSLEVAWEVWTRRDYGPVGTISEFAEIVHAVCGVEVVQCGDCAAINFESVMHHPTGGGPVCDWCLDAHYRRCNGCEDFTHEFDVTYVEEHYYCEACLYDHVSYCDLCEEYSHEPHRHDCDCEAPHPTFRFPANGAGLVRQDERLTVALPSGSIDEVGMSALAKALVRAEVPWDIAFSSVDLVGTEWQTKRGNWTRRISRELYSNHGIKLTPEALSELGNIARRHTEDESSWEIEVTRDLNLSPEQFYHDRSCWWGSEYESRCALKNWGGLGLRSFDPESDCITGRAWIQPISEALEPTHDAATAFAYIVYNGYGELSGYTAARIVSHLAGRTYRKIGLTLGVQYVNGRSGFLVADAETCREVDDVWIDHDSHFMFDAHDFKEAA